MDFKRLLIVAMLSATVPVLSACSSNDDDASTDGGNNGGNDGGNNGGNDGGNDGGNNGGGDGLTAVNLTGSDAALPIGTQEAAARYAGSLVNFVDSFAAMGAALSQTGTKALANCSNGGTRDTSTSGSTTTITFNDCNEGGAVQDGVMAVTTSASQSGMTSNSTFGQGGVPLVGTIQAEDIRTLQLGTINATAAFTFQGSSFNITDIDLSIPDLQSTVMRIDGSPRQDSRLTSYTVNIDNGQDTFSMSQAGTIASRGDCGTGTGTISTGTPLTVDKDSGEVTAGQMTLSSGGSSAVITFIGNNQYTVNAGGSTVTYTIGQPVQGNTCDFS